MVIIDINILYTYTKKEFSSQVNPYLQRVGGAVSQYTFTGELQSGVFLLVKSLKNGGSIVNNSKWQFIATRVVPRV